jgi:hypothetical protein
LKNFLTWIRLESSRKEGFIKVTPINQELPEIFVDILEWLGGGG